MHLSTDLYNFKCVLVDKNGTVWIGTHRYGLWFKKKGSNEFKLLDLPGVIKGHVFSLQESGKYLWIATYGDGLLKLNTQNHEIEHFSYHPVDNSTLSNNEIRKVVVDSKGNLWVCTQMGLNFKEPGSERFLRFFNERNNPFSLKSNQIFYCFEDTKGNIWIGTGGGGLSKTKPDTFKFKTYTTNEGLAGNYVFGIHEDLNGYLWISTDQGLSFFDPETESFRNFKAIDGIQGNQFNPGAVYRTSSGEMLFGGPNGFTLFDPAKIKLNPIQPNVGISGFKIKNVDSNISDFMVSEKNKDAQLILGYKQNAFTFSFITDNYLLPEKSKYEYRLKNFNENWITTDIPIAVYTNIPSGSYTFELKASNNDGIWNDTPYRLNIKIKTPPLLSKLAFIIYLLIITGLLILARKIILERQKLKQEIVFEKIQRKNEEELHQMKLRFFTNVSHEFRTPLSLILMLLERIIKKSKFIGKDKNELIIMRNNAGRMLRLINQLMDIRKIDNKKFRLKPQKVNVVSFCQNIYDCFNIYAEQKSIKYSFDAEKSIIHADVDIEMVDKIVYNLLSNAFKFSSEKGCIKLSIQKGKPEKQIYDTTYKVGEIECDNYVEIIVEDSGIGIVKDDLPMIFDRFYQTNEKQYRGTGLGLALSKEYIQLHKGEILVKSEINKGSRFIVRLPITQLNAIPEQSITVQDKNIEHVSLKDYNPKENMDVIQGNRIPGKINKKGEEAILIVEDNAELALFIESILIENYKVITAINGKQGFEKAIHYLPDLIISDIMMPEMDGHEFSRALKKDIRISHIPIIFLTALDSEENQIEGLKTGVDDYLTKPFNENILLLKIFNLLKSRENIREKYSGNNEEWSSKMIGLSSEKLFVKKVEQIVAENIDKSDFSVEDLAKKIGVSRSQLHRKLKYLTNYNPTEFIRFIRLEKAIELLKSGHKEIDQIGYTVGFNSHSYFSKCFKKQYGISPTEFLSQFGNGG